MTALRLGCCTKLENAPIAAAAGFDFIELGVATIKPMEDADLAAAIIAQAQAAPLPAEVFNCFVPGNIRLTGPDTKRAEQEAYLRRAIPRVAEAGGSIIVFGSGGARNIPEGFDHATAAEQMREFADMAGTIAMHHGVTVVIEPLREKESNLVNTVAEGYAMVEAVSNPGLELLADLFHLTANGEAVSTVADHLDRIRHIHIAQPETRKAPQGDNPQILELFGILQAHNYQGRVSIECSWDNIEQEAAETAANLRTAWANCAVSV